jgi:hypothetical protein
MHVEWEQKRESGGNEWSPAIDLIFFSGFCFVRFWPIFDLWSSQYAFDIIIIIMLLEHALINVSALNGPRQRIQIREWKIEKMPASDMGMEQTHAGLAVKPAQRPHPGEI